MHSLLHRSARIAAIIATLGASLAIGSATAAPPIDQTCPSNLFPGSDLNARYGVDERIVGPPGCRLALAGEHWVRAVPPWTGADAAAIDTFRQNFVSARWVTDAGSTGEFTQTAGPEALRWQSPEGTPFVTPGGLPFISPVSPAARPLSVGTHTSIVFVTMSAETCNGLTGAQAVCLPAGESQYDTPLSPIHPAPPADFEFVPPSN